MPKSKSTSSDDPPKPSLIANMSSLMRGASRHPPLQPAPQPAPHVPGHIANLDDIVPLGARTKAGTNPDSSVAGSSSVVWSAESISARLGGKPLSEQQSDGRDKTMSEDKDAEKGPVTVRVVKALLERFKEKLPVYSGLTLHDLSQDVPLSATLGAFCSLAASSPAPAPPPPSPPHTSAPLPPFSPAASVFSPAHALASHCKSTTSIPESQTSQTPARAAGAINLIAMSLCEMLDRVGKMSAPPTQILHSQVFLLQTLTIVLSARTRPSPLPSTRKDRARGQAHNTKSTRKPSANVTTPPSDHATRPSPSSSRPLPVPPLARDTPHEHHHPRNGASDTHTHTPTPAPLDAHVAKYALAVLLHFMKQSPQPPPRRPTSASASASALPAPATFPPVPLHGFEALASPDSHASSGLLSAAAVWSAPPLPWELPAFALASPSPPSSSSALTTPLTFNTLHARADVLPPTACFMPPAVLLTRFAARALYHLSMSNWGEVMARVSLRLGALAGGGEGGDAAELRGLGFVAMDRERLGRVMQELASLFVNMKPPAQALTAASVRVAIFAWLEHAPHEFHAAPRIEGAARLFDAVSSKARVVRGGAGEEGRGVLWTALGALICVCPERLSAAEGGKKNNLLVQLSRFVHAPGPNANIALRVYTDVCRASFFLPPECEGCSLKNVALEVVEDLASFIEHYPPHSALEPIDVDLYADALVAIYRHSPARAQPLISAFLERERSEAVKLCVVKAAMTLVVEAEAFPWQPSLIPLLQTSTKRLNLILRALLRDGEESDMYPASPLPLSTTYPGDRTEIRRVLLISVQGLLRLDIAFFIYGPSLSDLSEVNRDGVHVLTPPRDHGLLVSCLCVYATWIERARSVQKGDRFHSEAVAYMNASVLTTLFACAQEVVHVWHNTENTICIHAVHHILKILAELADNNEDTSWRLSEARLPALAMTEVALITAYKSAEPEISTTAAKSFGLLGKVANDPQAPIPSYLTRGQLQTWSPAFGTLSDDALPTGGRVALQKAMRKMALHAPACATHISAWRECHYRWSVLSPIVSVPEGSIVSPLETEIGPETYKARQMEWTSHTLSLAAASAVCMSEIDGSFFRIIGTHLPDRMPLHREPAKLVRSFVAQLVDMLVARTLHVRETVKQALGGELSLKVVPLLFEHLNSLIPELLRELSVPPDLQLIIFVDQIVAVLGLIAERIGKEDHYFLKCDLGDFILPMARFLDRISTSASELRSKALFCELLQKLGKRRDVFTIRRNNGVRHTLLDIMMNWASETMTTVGPAEFVPEFIRAQRRCQTAALRDACDLAENLRLEPLDGSTGNDTQHVISRLFHRYLTTFIKALDFSQPSESRSRADSDRLSQSSEGLQVTVEAHILESVIAGIAHLVNANTDVGFKRCVELGYDDDYRLRAVFMKVFSRVLKHGTRFDVDDTLKLGKKQGQLSELVRGSPALVNVIVSVCTSSEVDTMVPVLLNVLDTRRAMLTLLKSLISSEVNDSGSPTDIFRQNNVCGRLLSAFARQHGYLYLRHILAPLIEQMLELPVGCSFELDPTKLPPGEDVENNARLVTRMTQAFIDQITASAPYLPSVLIDICYHISETVNQVWPGSKYSAVGGFLFLRFICPVVVSPDVIDLDLPPQHPHTPNLRRGLVLVAKILQNLANNIMFGKEAHLVFLNPLLESNIIRMTQFLGDTFIAPSQEHDIDRWLGTSCDDTDTFVLQHFFQVHHDEVGKLLLTKASEDPQLIQTPSKDTWVRLCDILVNLGNLADPPTPTEAPAAANFIFLNFMSVNAHRNTGSVDSIFFACEGQRDVFVLRLEKVNVELTDLELLMYHIFQTLMHYLSSPYAFKVVIDFTKFAPESELPLDWLKLCVEMTPSDLRQKIQSIYILNANSLAQKFLRKVFYVCAGVPFAREIHAVASVSQLFEHISRVESIAQSSTGALENEPCQLFENVYERHVHHTWTSVTLEVRVSHIRVISGKAHSISPTLMCKTVDVVPLEDVDDIYRVASATDPNEFVLARNERGIALQFSSPDRDLIIQSIRSAKFHAEASGPLVAGRFGGLSDITATLLTIGLINTCHEQGWPRGAANMLLAAVCTYLKYEAVVAILPAKSNSIILNPSAAIVLFSERIASFAPHLTLDLLTDFRLGFNKASTLQKITCLSYLSPWVRNLDHFANPTNRLFDQSGTKLRDAVRSLIDITLRDTEVYPLVQQHVWTELARMEKRTVNIATEELIRVAVDGGVESRRCEVVADVVMTLSSIHVRSRIITRLRQALRRAILRSPQVLTTNVAWGEIAALSRLALAASHNPRSSIQNELLLPETAHLVTMLAATGPLSMRTSVYGMAVNVMHAILASRVDDEAVLPELRRHAEEASSPAMVHCFGLSQNQSSMAYSTANSVSDQIDPSSLEAITKMMSRALVTGATTPGLLNVWRARWMSLVTATAFQEFPYLQTRAFTALGVLVDSNLDDDFFYQILVALKNAIQRSPEGGCSAVLSMLRCICKLVPNLVDNSRYLPGVFWAAVALLQTGHLHYYVQAMQLLPIVLEKLQTQGAFHGQSVPFVLLAARSHLSRELVEFDDVSGFSFVDEISFSLSLAFLLLAVSKHQTLRPIASDTIRSILCVVAKPGPTMRTVAPSLVGFVLASLPFCTTVPELRALLEDANVEVSQWEAEGTLGSTLDGGTAAALPFPLLGVSDARSAELIIAALYAIIEPHQGSVPERELLWSIIMDANEDHPFLVFEAQIHHLTVMRTDWVEPRVAMAYSASSTKPIVESMRAVLNSMVGYEDQWNSTNASTSTLSTVSGLKSTAHYRSLEELGMEGMLKHMRSEFGYDKEQFAPKEFKPLLDRVLAVV